MGSADPARYRTIGRWPCRRALGLQAPRLVKVSINFRRVPVFPVGDEDIFAEMADVAGHLAVVELQGQVDLAVFPGETQLEQVGAELQPLAKLGQVLFDGLRGFFPRLFLQVSLLQSRSSLRTFWTFLPNSW